MLAGKIFKIPIMPDTKAFKTSQKSYRIRVEGSLDPSWSDRLGGMAITSKGMSGIKTVTVLEGELTDQSALIGVLNTLHELHLPVELVEGNCADAPDEVRDDPSKQESAR